MIGGSIISTDDFLKLNPHRSACDLGLIDTSAILAFEFGCCTHLPFIFLSNTISK